MIQIVNNKKEYYTKFLEFKYFKNYIKFVISDLDCSIYVDEEENPNCVILYAQPAYFIYGNPKETDLDSVFSCIKSDSWIIPDSPAWTEYFKMYYKDKVQIYPRILFDASQLSLEQIKKIKNPLPGELKIVRITDEHVQKGIIYDDVVSRFFTVRDFESNGFGFALVDERGVAQGFALTNYPALDKDIELYFRVGYEDFPKHRNQGLGTNLCAHFIEYCLENGYNPQWDAATDISAHVAKKFGYIEKEKWEMYHVL